uniref:WWE domain-containing protein n=1 Tax=Oryza meridionalis TaxID=40149 RepID=A0A0E0DMH0_9ORYZ
MSCHLRGSLRNASGRWMIHALEEGWLMGEVVTSQVAEFRPCGAAITYWFSEDGVTNSANDRSTSVWKWEWMDDQTMWSGYHQHSAV